MGIAWSEDTIEESGEDDNDYNSEASLMSSESDLDQLHCSSSPIATHNCRSPGDIGRIPTAHRELGLPRTKDGENILHSLMEGKFKSKDPDNKLGFLVKPAGRLPRTKNFPKQRPSKCELKQHYRILEIHAAGGDSRSRLSFWCKIETPSGIVTDRLIDIVHIIRLHPKIKLREFIKATFLFEPKRYLVFYRRVQEMEDPERDVILKYFDRIVLRLKRRREQLQKEARRYYGRHNRERNQADILQPN